MGNRKEKCIFCLYELFLFFLMYDEFSDIKFFLRTELEDIQIEILKVLLTHSDPLDVSWHQNH